MTSFKLDVAVFVTMQWPDDNLKKIEDTANQRFVRRVLFFFKPVNKLFSTLELNNPASKLIASAGQEFLYFLLNCGNVSIASHRHKLGVSEQVVIKNMRGWCKF